VANCPIFSASIIYHDRGPNHDLLRPALARRGEVRVGREGVRIVPLTLAVLLLAGMLPQDNLTFVTGVEPGPMVLVLGDPDAVLKFQPLDPETFGKDGLRRLDFDFKAGGAGANLARRKVDDEKSTEPIPLRLPGATVDGRPCLVLEMDQVPGTAPLAKDIPFSLRLRAVEPDKLRQEYGPGVYEGLAWFRIFPDDPRGPNKEEQKQGLSDSLKGGRQHQLRLRLVIPGRRVAQLKVEGTPAVGQRLKVFAAIEEVLAGARSEASADDRLQVDIAPQGEAIAPLKLPWPVPVGAWDPQDPGAKGERSGWAVPEEWLDEPILGDGPGPKQDRLVENGPARSIVHRDSFRLPPLYAPGTLTVRISPAGATSRETDKIAVKSGLLVTPSLAFLPPPGEPPVPKERIVLRAILARGEGGVADPPDKVQVRVESPSGQSQTFTLSSDGRETGYVTYALKREQQPRVGKAGKYKVTPATGKPALDKILGGEVVVLVALEKDDSRLLGQERVAFMRAEPIHWPLIKLLNSNLENTSETGTKTLEAIKFKALLGTAEIDRLSLWPSPMTLDPPPGPHDNARDGDVHFALVADPKSRTKGPPWTVDTEIIALALIVKIKPENQKAPPSIKKGIRTRSERFVIAGVGSDKEKIGRIFRESFSYKIAEPWDYYVEWAWLPGLILLGSLLVWYIRRAGGRKRKVPRKAASSKAASDRPGPADGRSRVRPAWTEPEPSAAPTKPPEPPRRELPKKPGPPPRSGKRPPP
jgi:hypothetical protein